MHNLLVDNSTSDENLLSDAALAAELRAFEDAERTRLGLGESKHHWTDTMLAPTMTRRERDNVTLLCGGLTAAQDLLIAGALSGLGYNVQHLRVPDVAALQTGKEFGNRGQCNPTYFTVGNLVRTLVDLRDKEGLSAAEIIRRYVFVTAGACGPCRFGMYVTEYRKALRDAGFEGFRVMLFQQKGGLSQASGEEVGLEMTPKFFIGLLKAIICGDVLNAIAYRIRPYEIEAGATNRALEQSKRIMHDALRDQSNFLLALLRCRQLFANIEVDKLRIRPKISIIGEFWAMTTEGDGNYHLQRFLESEGGENDIQLTSAWLLYNIWEVARDTRVRRTLRTFDHAQVGLGDLDDVGVTKRLAAMRLADKALRSVFHAMALPTGLHDYHLPDMEEVADVAKDYYSNDLRGGEGHMEVGKVILNAVRGKSHMTLSVKPFGCMPSSGVSDGVQSLISARYPGSIFCAVETSGDGATNFYSRVQMYLYKAKIAAEKEYHEALAKTGVSEAEVRAFLANNKKYRHPLHHAPHVVAGSAANLVYEVAPLIVSTRRQRAQQIAGKLGRTVWQSATAVPTQARKLRQLASDGELRARVHADWELMRDVAAGKTKTWLAPLGKKISARISAS